MSALAPTLVILATLWPAVLTAAFVDHADEHLSGVSVGVYLAAARVCHQRPDRSFATAGQQWPVCGRCAGLYLGAPFGAWGSMVVARRRPRAGRLTSESFGARAPWIPVAIAAVPTAMTVASEVLWPDAVRSWHRFAAALPLGVVLAHVVVDAARLTRQSGAID